MVVAVSFWKYDQASINERKRNRASLGCKDEEWFKTEFNKQMRKNFDLEEDLKVVFPDYLSQTDFKEDKLQQDHWLEQTNIIWEIASNQEEAFNFHTIEDILKENGRKKREIQRLEDHVDTLIEGNTNEINNLRALMERLEEPL